MNQYIFLSGSLSVSHTHTHTHTYTHTSDHLSIRVRVRVHAVIQSIVLQKTDIGIFSAGPRNIFFRYRDFRYRGGDKEDEDSLWRIDPFRSTRGDDDGDGINSGDKTDSGCLPWAGKNTEDKTTHGCESRRSESMRTEGAHFHDSDDCGSRLVLLLRGRRGTSAHQ